MAHKTLHNYTSSQRTSSLLKIVILETNYGKNKADKSAIIKSASFVVIPQPYKVYAKNKNYTRAREFQS